MGAKWPAHKHHHRDDNDVAKSRGAKRCSAKLRHGVSASSYLPPPPPPRTAGLPPAPSPPASPGHHPHTYIPAPHRHISLPWFGWGAQAEAARPGSDRLCSPAVVGRSEEGLPTRPPDQTSRRHPPTHHVTTAALLPFLSGGQWEVCSSLAEERWPVSARSTHCMRLAQAWLALTPSLRSNCPWKSSTGRCHSSSTDTTCAGPRA